MAQDLNPGDIIRQQHGPFRAEWEVAHIVDAGAILVWKGTVEFVGFDHVIEAPSGAPLTTTTSESFLGRAHWPSADLVNATANP